MRGIDINYAMISQEIAHMSTSDVSVYENGFNTNTNTVEVSFWPLNGIVTHVIKTFSLKEDYITRIQTLIKALS